EEGLRAPLAACARKKASGLLRSRLLMKKLTQATVEDGELREKLGCQRSSRLSPLVLPDSSDLDTSRGSGLSRIKEFMVSEGEQDEEMGGVVRLQRGLPSPVRDSGLHSPMCPVPCSLLPMPVEVADGVAAQGGVAMPEDSGAGGSVAGESQHPSIDLVSSNLPPLLADSLVVGPVILTSSVEASSVEDGELLTDSDIGEVLEGSQSVALGATLRPPSSDGRQQWPQTSAVTSFPVAGVGHGSCGVPVVGLQRVSSCAGGQQDAVGDGLDRDNARGEMGRSYVFAVGSDRRSDVRLHFMPPVMPDDRVDLCMMDSDRDEMEWKV
ncbi:hypothetical protein Dimus_003457, partial [Dionaea muscipula]